MEQQLEASILGMWVFLVTEIMFFGGMFMIYILYRILYPEAWVLGSNHLNVVARRAQHGRADLQLADDGAGGAIGAGRHREGTGRQPDPDDHLRIGLPDRQVLRVRGEVRAPSRARAALRHDAAARQPAAALLLDLLHDDGHPRPAHGGRHRPDARDSRDGAGAARSRRATTRRSKCPASTGTSSTSSGSSCSRSCTCWARTCGARTEAEHVERTHHRSGPDLRHDLRLACSC